MYKVSVVVVTYNPSEKKLRDTLKSILLQKNIAYQIVIADDGSRTPRQDVSEALFAQCGFTDYEIVANPQNRGTVYNVLSGVERSTGQYVKVISPGDMLNGEDILYNWVADMEKENAQLSFSDAVCYGAEDGQFQLVQGTAHPKNITCYLEKDIAQIRRNYLIFDDLMLGAAIVCRRDVLLDYLRQIAGKVVYAEDNAYRLMVYDKIPMHYFAAEAVIYELGTGISTSGNDIWMQRLSKDWNACTQLLLARCTGKDPIDNELRLCAKGGFARKAVKLWCILTNKKTRQAWKAGKQPRLTGQTLPESFLKQITKEA